MILINCFVFIVIFKSVEIYSYTPVNDNTTHKFEEISTSVVGTRKNENRPDAGSVVTESGNHEEIEENQDIEQAPNLTYQNHNELQESSSSPTRSNVKNKTTTASKLPRQHKAKDTKSTVETPMKQMKRLSNNLGLFLFKSAKPHDVSATSAKEYPESGPIYGNLMEMEELSKSVSKPNGKLDRKITATTPASTFVRQHNAYHTGSPSTSTVHNETKRPIHLGNQIAHSKMPPLHGVPLASNLNNRQSSYSVYSEDWTYEPLEEVYEQLE
ncbi:uncharacterized protein LOC133520496 isoform X2 [Cydia pomonella]|uniref:uncharacterized protein LOC133520496 isoform X2 n=1 Tax=Cydia pomonella TaxID=82600 RepID=UPI002ADD8F26|nr:uncharacterized protein LOC133520496 isoform X2 [Cydia pomonella]